MNPSMSMVKLHAGLNGGATTSAQIGPGRAEAREAENGGRRTGLLSRGWALKVQCKRHAAETGSLPADDGRSDPWMQGKSCSLGNTQITLPYCLLESSYSVPSGMRRSLS